MGKTIMGGAAVSLDGFMADEQDGIGPLFDWLGTGDVAWTLANGDGESRSTQASADFMREHYANVACVVMGRRLFDLTNGWDGVPAAGEHVFVCGSGRPFFATGPLGEPLMLENPSRVVQGDRVTHLVYDVRR
jgi:dihydrofolate reductase